jgi:iron complex outermembrane receptor protein
VGLLYNWGEQVEDNSPLAEIQPLLFNLMARTPRYRSFAGRFLYQYAARQDRVDESLNESPTESWQRVDIGVDMETGHFVLALGVENLLNELYAQHLSYLRNPFSSGLAVYEPGRTIRITVTFVF